MKSTVAQRVTAEVPESTPGLRQIEDAWCATHGEVLDGYAGQWVVLEGEEIIAHGEEPAPLVEKARARGIESPYVFYVEPSRPGVVKLGL